MLLCSNIFLIFPLWHRSLQHTCRRQGRWGMFPTAACALQVNCLSFPLIFSITYFITYCCILSLLNFMVTRTQSKISSHVTNANSDWVQAKQNTVHSGSKPKHQTIRSEAQRQKSGTSSSVHHSVGSYSLVISPGTDSRDVNTRRIVNVLPPDYMRAHWRFLFWDTWTDNISYW